MSKLTKNFSRKEFECSCGCGADTIDFETLTLLQKVRDRFGRPVTVTSGYRCLAYNRSIGSNDNSQHPKGRAVDFSIPGVEPVAIFEYLHDKHPKSLGLGLYPTFVHLDTRTSGPARWGSAS